MKLSVFIFFSLLSVAKAQETTSGETTIAPVSTVSAVVSPVSDAADTTAETTTAEASKAPSATPTETVTTTAPSIETTTSQVSASSLPSISTTPSNCRDATTSCLAYKQLCEVPERCRRPQGSGSGSHESSSGSHESGSGEKGSKSKENDRHARSTDTDSDDDQIACDWVHQQQNPSLSQVNAQCTPYIASPLQFSIGGRIDNGPGGKQDGGGRPNRAPLDCLFREMIAKLFRLLCPLTCGTCK